MTNPEGNSFFSWVNSRLGRKKTPKLYRGQEKFSARYPDYEIGLGSYGMPIVHDWQEGTKLSIGAYTSIADDVHIFLGGQHRTDWVSSYPFPAFLEAAAHISSFGGSRGDVRIGSDVWLASGCTVLSGVTVGDGAVVAARAVVSRNVEPYSVVVGNPARHVRFRFEKDVREALLECAWWNWPESEVQHVVNLLCSEDIEVFLNYARAR